jgi:hypothetical protein
MECAGKPALLNTARSPILDSAGKPGKPDALLFAFNHRICGIRRELSFALAQ